MKTEWEHRQQMVAIGQRMYQRGYVAATDGNISVKMADDRILITPTGTCLGELRPEELVAIEQGGSACDPNQRPSSELPMHLEVYGQRSDVGAVIHAHPPLATAFTVAGISLAQCVIPEVVLTMGTIPTTKYATPSTEQGREQIRELIRCHDALILDRHGTLTVGPDLITAYRRLEKVEHAAQVTLAARQLGNVRTLPPEEVKRLETMRAELGLGTNVEVCNNCGTCGKDVTGEPELPPEVDERVVDVVVEEVLRVLGEKV
ncbi:class II aldolase/adducin family protein [bacterium]|nr:class II aldolase/adducin family protein [bacterium]